VESSIIDFAARNGKKRQERRPVGSAPTESPQVSTNRGLDALCKRGGLVTVLHIFSSTIGMGKQGKTEVGTEVGKRSSKNPTQIWPYLCGILFWLLSQLAPDTRLLRLLKMIYNATRIWNKQKEMLTFSLSPVKLGIRHQERKKVYFPLTPPPRCLGSSHWSCDLEIFRISCSLIR